jgi:hypothetical protein
MHLGAPSPPPTAGAYSVIGNLEADLLPVTVRDRPPLGRGAHSRRSLYAGAALFPAGQSRAERVNLALAELARTC